ncbi:MAG TPA: GNAT family N-acetyltransferase [Phycisphaerae bacterium]|nr:GNAT family N-acetyltransferase [Phycisphaerae bacterium]
METPLGTSVLRDRRPVDLLCLQPPAGRWRDRIAPFLAHKGQPWNWQIEKHLDAPADKLESRFYVALCGGTLISHIMTAEHAGVGLLGHVYTDPAWRGQRAASILMKVVCDDFADRGGIVMNLGTEYDTSPWRIYQRFGFQGLRPPSGLMRWVVQPEAYERLFAPAQAHFRPVAWQDWPLLQTLLQRPEGDWLRNRTLRAYGSVCDAEASFLEFMSWVDRGEASARVLANDSGAAVGLVSVAPFHEVPSDALQLSLYVHPHFAERTAALLAAAELPQDRPMVCYIDSGSPGRERALIEVGFGLACRLEGFCRTHQASLDLLVFRRG